MRVQHQGQTYTLRSAVKEDAPALRKLLNTAYKELADLGLNYTATYQDEAETRKQIENYRVFVLFAEDELIATINAREENWFTNRKSLYVGKFAVQPHLKGKGLGALLMKFIEDTAKTENYESVQLDTAKPAEHLVNLYQRAGYKVIGETHFEGKTYDSWIFEKVL